MRLSTEIETSYGMYELYLYQECKLSCEECFNNCKFGYRAKELNGKVEV
jgi:hypothetical protein